MRILHNLRRSFWKIGLDISEFTPASHPVARRKQILKAFEIDTVLDIGANSGHFAQLLRKDIGYKKRILSFEPLSSAFKALQKKAERDPAWDVFNYALGDSEGGGKINIAGNSLSSSILNILPSHVNAAPKSKYIGNETIEIKTLDSIFNDLCRNSGNIYMKIDTQGYESKVLKGAEHALEHINTIQLEMSIVPLYEGELLYLDMFNFLTGKGYTLIDIEGGFADPVSGRLLQFDGIFHRF